MRQMLSFVILLSFYSCQGQTRPSEDAMIVKLKSADFGIVCKAKDSLIDKGKESIPKLIELLKDTSFVKLKNTADLIYPGTDKFYGHGWIVNYDIDWIAVRSAWLLEELTFHDFGYQAKRIKEDTLTKLHQQDYATYLQTGRHNIDFKAKTPRQQLITYRLMLADSVLKWWDSNKAAWTRYNALKEALNSKSLDEQRRALYYLQYDGTLCGGLTPDNYKKEIKPLLEKIKKSKNENAKMAMQQLNSDEGYFYKIKQL